MPNVQKSNKDDMIVISVTYNPDLSNVNKFSYLLQIVLRK